MVTKSVPRAPSLRRPSAPPAHERTSARARDARRRESRTATGDPPARWQHAATNTCDGRRRSPPLSRRFARREMTSERQRRRAAQTDRAGRATRAGSRAGSCQCNPCARDSEHPETRVSIFQQEIVCMRTILVAPRRLHALRGYCCAATTARGSRLLLRSDDCTRFPVIVAQRRLHALRGRCCATTTARGSRLWPNWLLAAARDDDARESDE
jgi:hypothetical protein